MRNKKNKYHQTRKYLRNIQKRTTLNNSKVRDSFSTTENEIGLRNIAYIYESELNYIGKCILDYPRIETGGQLFGFWTASGVPVVVYAIGPGPKANHQVTFFNQDIEYLKFVGRILVSEFGLMHIGEWHSHHQLGLDKPSGHDAETMQHSIDNLHLNRFLLCIGNCNGIDYSIKPYIFMENHKGYNSSLWKIKGDMSPFRSAIDKYLSTIKLQKRHEPKDEYSWFSVKSNRVRLKNILDFLKAKSGAIDSKAQLKENIVEIITRFQDRHEVIYFPPDFPKSPITLTLHYGNGCIKEIRPEPSLINCSEKDDVFLVFKQQYNSICQ